MKKFRIKRQAKIFLVSFLVTVAVLLLLILSTAIYVKKTKTLPPFIGSIIQHVTNTQATDLNDNLPMNILVLGGDEKQGGRSDTIMLIHLRKDYQPVVISIPRDTKVSIEGVKGDSKINAAYAYGKAKLAVKTVEDILNIKVDKYVAVNYEAVKKIVDLVGGVDVDVPFHLDYKDLTPGKELIIDIPAGMQHLSGDEAVKFLRWRHNSNGKEYGPGGDLGRIEMQRRLINALINKFIQPQNLVKIPVILQNIAKFTEHNFTKGEMMWFAQNIGKFDTNNIIMTILPGSPRYINNVSYFIMDDEKSKKLIEDLNDPDIIKEDVHIKILYNKLDDDVSSLKDMLISNNFVNIDLARAYPKLSKNDLILKRVNKKYLDAVMSSIDKSVYQIVYSPDYNDKYDIYIKIAN